MKYSRSNIVAWSTVLLLKRSQVSTSVSAQAKQNPQSKREDVAIALLAKEHICMWCSRVTESGAQCVAARFATLPGPNLF